MAPWIIPSNFLQKIYLQRSLIQNFVVGDLIFQHRCMHRMNQLRDSGKTIILVTHDLDAIVKFCDRALLLDGGHLLEDGKPDLVVQKYRALIFERERQHGGFDGSGDPQATEPASLKEMPVARRIPNIDHRFGNGEAVLLGIALLDGSGCPVSEAFGGQAAVIRISAQCKQDIDRPIIGYTIRNRLGVEMSGCNTSYAGKPLPPARKDQIITSDFHVTFPNLAPGSYSISPAVAKGSVLRHDMCDWIDNALVFALASQILVYGMVRMDVDVHSYISQVAQNESRMEPTSEHS